jgi:glycosyltransferase involved in cell wall biosynthesis
VSVVVPTLNEAENLPHVFARIPGWVHEIVLVDGYSTDDTVSTALSLRPDVRVVEQDRKGKGRALACGFKAARGDIIVMLDADGSADPGEISRFVGTLTAGADFAKGTRYAEGGGSSDITWLRSAGNRFFGALVNLLYRTKYSDLCYGYNAFWQHCAESIDMDRDGFEVETAINVRIARAGFAVEEVPSFEHDRIHGQSNLRTFSDGWRVLRTILGELRRPRPARVEPPRRLIAQPAG